MQIFLSTLNQLAFLFGFIIIGYILAKFKIVSQDAASILSKLENTLFIPALIMGTFIKNFTVQQLSSALDIFLISFAIVLIVIPIVTLISKCITKDKYERNIYTYGLAFSNFAFMGNAVVSVIFPDMFLQYLIFTLPLWIMIYLYGVPNLLLKDNNVHHTIAQRFKALLNPMIIAMFIGMIIGLTGIKLPSFITSIITVSGDCMSPIAMLLTGITVSTISFKKTFTNIRIYAVSIVRLLVLPLAFIGISKLIPMDNTVFICALCSLAMPLGLNTIVIPSAYGRDTTVASGMAVISHLLSCITIPFIFALI